LSAADNAPALHAQPPYECELSQQAARRRQNRESMNNQAMRNGQNKRMRGRNNRKSQNPLTRVYESNGPDVKIRGTASHVADKYLQLARDAQTSGDPVGAENYFQHAEHYFRLIAAAQEQFRQSNPYYRPETEPRDSDGDETDEDVDTGAPGEHAYGARDPQPYLPPDAQPFPREAQQFPRDGQQYGGHQQRGGRDHQRGGRDQHPGGREPQYTPRAPQPAAGPGEQPAGDVDGLPAFITGGGQPPAGPPPQGYGQQNGHDGQGDRFPLHRRRRRHRGPRHDQGGPQGIASEGPDDGAPRE
jgi:uncharacterized protein DUF4167